MAEERKTRETAISLAIAAVLAVLIAAAADRLVLRGIYSWASHTSEYREMLVELAVLYFLLAASLCLVRRPLWKLGLTAAVSAVFLWCHVVLVPMAVAAAYVAYLAGVGYLLRRCVFQVRTEEGCWADFLLGSAAVITAFCLMSALGIGAIRFLRAFVAVTAVLVIAGTALLCRRGRGNGPLRMAGMGGIGACSRTQLLMIAFILLMVLLEAGRMNISVDFDTLWYSVRSEYMLDNGPLGIYENMGTVSLVYTYSKGWEVLTLPLCDLPSHSFLLSFNLIVMCGCLLLAWRIALRYMKAGWALTVPFLMAGMPGIMNMGISGKSDSVTLFLQLILLFYMTEYICRRRTADLILSFGALLLSWTMKPTALIFSTLVFGMSGIYLLAARKLSLRGKAGEWLSVLPCGAALLLIWYRTYLFVGVPVTSVFSGIFQKIGFRVKYPFLVWSLPGYGAKETVSESVRQLLGRLWGVFCLPEGDSMSRVLIAWCSLIVVFLALVWLGSLFLPKQKPAEGNGQALLRYGRTLLIPLILGSIYSIQNLKQVDGNYFILPYVTAILSGCGLMARLESRVMQRRLKCLLIPLTLFNVMMVSLSNLAWSVGFTPVQWIHPGYCDHEEQQYEEMVESGNEQIWNILAADPQTRLIAFGSHPKSLSFPCNVQTYTDITSSSGNEALAESADAFREYMEYAGTDYIYVEAGYLTEDQWAFRLLGDSIRAGILTDVRHEYGNVIARVDLGGRPGETADQNFETFQEFYVRGSGTEK